MEVAEVKQKAKELKATIEEALKKFRVETGYTPGVEVTTRSRPTNETTLVSQQVTITITM